MRSHEEVPPTGDLKLRTAAIATGLIPGGPLGGRGADSRLGSVLGITW